MIPLALDLMLIREEKRREEKRSRETDILEVHVAFANELRSALDLLERSPNKLLSGSGSQNCV